MYSYTNCECVRSLFVKHINLFLRTLYCIYLAFIVSLISTNKRARLLTYIKCIWDPYICFGKRVAISGGFISRRRRGGAVGWGTALQTGRSRLQFPMVPLDFFYWHNPVGRTMALGSTQPLTEMSARSISCGVKAAGAYGRPYRLHVPIV
jgi:hypothetical protein